MSDRLDTKMISSSQMNPLLPSIEIVERVADAKGVAAEELTSIYEAIDADALDTLIQSETDGGAGISHLQFQYEGYTIVAAADGQIELTAHDA